MEMNELNCGMLECETPKLNNPSCIAKQMDKSSLTVTHTHR